MKADIEQFKLKIMHPNYHVKKEDINSFLTDSNRSKIYKRLLIIATDKIGSNAIKTIVDQKRM